MSDESKTKMSEKNIMRMYETMAQIASEKYNVKVTVTVKKKEDAA